MNYWEYSFKLENPDVFNQILIAELAELGFESFEESGHGVSAYVPENIEVSEYDLNMILENFGTKASLEKQFIKDQNWNETWEKDFPVVTIGKRCIVRAPFHIVRPGKYGIDILIQPKMSFGTGHHETTYLMLGFMLDQDLSQASLLDMGSGTGVLAIAAYKLKAQKILAVDIEEWAFENTIENIALNSAHVDVNKGDVNSISGLNFDIILANINKNVLLADMNLYYSSLNEGGSLFISGFFNSDVDEILVSTKRVGLVLKDKREKNGWAAMHLTKPE